MWEKLEALLNPYSLLSTQRGINSLSFYGV